MTAVDDPRLAYLTLACLVEPGSRELGQRIATVGPVAALHDLLAGRRCSATLRGAVEARLGGVSPARIAADALADATRLGARIVTPLDDEWPPTFADLWRISRTDRGRHERDTLPPLCLWVRGDPPLADVLDRSVSIVGARAATPYGEHVASGLGYDLAGHGWTVVSGGAYGVDSAAHRGALRGGLPTVAVLACGIDRPYPASNTGLFERISGVGLVITEWPPGAHPHRHRFLIRNRVIAAATRGTVVVEAAARSGAIQTLRRARDLRRVPMAVPGPVTSAMSVGCHEALRIEGVRLVTGWAHVLEEVGCIGDDLAPLPRGPEYAHDRLEPVAAQVFDAVRRTVSGPEAIAATAGVSVREALSALGLLSATGLIEVRDGGYALPAPRRPP